MSREANGPVFYASIPSCNHSASTFQGTANAYRAAEAIVELYARFPDLYKTAMVQ